MHPLVNIPRHPVRVQFASDSIKVMERYCLRFEEFLHRLVPYGNVVVSGGTDDVMVLSVLSLSKRTSQNTPEGLTSLRKASAAKLLSAASTCRCVRRGIGSACVLARSGLRT